MNIISDKLRAVWSYRVGAILNRNPSGKDSKGGCGGDPVTDADDKKTHLWCSDQNFYQDEKCTIKISKTYFLNFSKFKNILILHLWTSLKISIWSWHARWVILDILKFYGETDLLSHYYFPYSFFLSRNVIVFPVQFLNREPSWKLRVWDTGNEIRYP